MIFTFYSYKGGVGRTMALANVGEAFRRLGLKVLLVDWDLEAPGLERYFPKQAEEILTRPGLMEILADYKTRMAEERPEDEKAALLPEIADYLTTIPGSGESQLRVLSAGKRGKGEFAEYARRVQTFDWHDFYHNWEGEVFFEWLRNEFERLADVVLIDSRTGVTEIGGVSVYQFADVVLMFCAPNQQNIEGSYEMARAFSRREVAELRQGRPLDILIVPARVEDRAEARLLNAFKEQFVAMFDAFLPASLIGRLDSFWDLKIPYVPYYSFNEGISLLDADSDLSEDLVHSFNLLAGHMRSFLPSAPALSEKHQELAPIELTSQVRILVVIPDEKYRRFLSELLRHWGYDGMLVDGIGRELISQSLDLAKSYRPHAAIIQLRLQDEYDEEDVSGMELVRKLESAHCILATGLSNMAILRGLLETRNQVDIFIKSDSPQKMQDVIRNAVRDTPSARDLKIDLPINWRPERIVEAVFGREDPVPAALVGDVMGRLFPAAKKLKLESISSAGESGRKSVSEPGSQSTMFRVWEDDYEPVIIKLSSVEKIREEVDRYEKYIAKRVSGSFTIRVERYVTFWELGGMIYSAPFEKDVKTFSSLYNERGYQELLKALRYLFMQAWGRQYEKQRSADIPLLSYYSQTYNLGSQLPRLSPWKDARIQNLLTDYGLPNPAAWLLHRKQEQIFHQGRWAITHGNLRGDTILFDDRGTAWAIDFQYSGEGPIFRDFGSLELSILVELLAFSEKDLHNFLALGILLASPGNLRQTGKSQRLRDEGFNKALNLIQGLRGLASSVADEPDFQEYLWTVLLSGLNLAATLAQNNPARSRALLYCSVICHRLDHWDEPWPPENWPDLLGSS